MVVVIDFSIFHPIRTYARCRDRLTEMTPYEKWKLLRAIIVALSNTMGTRVMLDCKRNILTAVPPLVAGTAAVIQFYSLYFYWHINIITALQPLSIWALSAPVRICLHI